jgi:hypothetical protein
MSMLQSIFSLYLTIQRFREALRLLLSAAIPRAEEKEKDRAPVTDDTVPDCSICLSETGPLQALFIGPCSHCYHYKCVQRLLFESPMFQCPLCRQMSNLTASLSSEQVDHLEIGSEDEIAHANFSNLDLHLGGSGARSQAPPRQRTKPDTPERLQSPEETRHPVGMPSKITTKGTKFSKRVTTFFQKVAGSNGAASNAPDDRENLAGTQGSLNSIRSSNASLSPATPNQVTKTSLTNLNCATTPRKLGITTGRMKSMEMLGDVPSSAKVEEGPGWEGIEDTQRAFIRRANTSKESASKRIL